MAHFGVRLEFGQFRGDLRYPWMPRGASVSDTRWLLVSWLIELRLASMTMVYDADCLLENKVLLLSLHLYVGASLLFRPDRLSLLLSVILLERLVSRHAYSAYVHRIRSND